jgi:thermitase
VAVLDTGIDDAVKALQGKVIGKTNFTDSKDTDASGHGTFMAGIIAATIADNGIGGVAYECSLLDVKVAENDGTTNDKKVAQGIIWAADHGANVINISLVIYKPSSLLESAIQYAWGKNCVIVASVGNDASSSPVYPAAYPRVIGVAASDSDDNLTKWSNHGEWVKVAAPGEKVYSTLPNNDYGYMNGSSCSTALVSGEAALFFARDFNTSNGYNTNDEINAAIINNCDDILSAMGTVKRINVYKAALSDNNKSGGLP